MAGYKITIINDEFTSSEEHECSDQVAAREHAIASALAIATEQVKPGKPFFGAHVTIATEGEDLAHFVVSVGASMLQISDPLGKAN